MTGSNENARDHACKSLRKIFSHIYDYNSEMLLQVKCQASVVKSAVFFLALSKEGGQPRFFLML